MATPHNGNPATTKNTKLIRAGTETGLYGGKKDSYAYIPPGRRPFLHLISRGQEFQSTAGGHQLELTGCHSVG